MGKELLSLLETTLIPQVIEQIILKDKINEIEAINMFYNSKTYEVLLDEDSAVWHFSPLTIYNMYKEEKEKGKIIFPIEG